MKSLFFPCHMCGSYDAKTVTAAFLADGGFCNFQNIVICKKCGLVYKNPVIPELNKIVYDKHSWGDGAAFNKRISDLSSYLSDFLKRVSPKTIMEIGPGPGWLAMAIKKILPDSQFLLFEASDDVVELTKQNLPDETVIPSSIEEVSIKKDSIDFALVCGVDYLFSDFRGAINKIYTSLKSGGYLYIERNVFVEAEAYAWFPIRTYKDLFGQNALMTTWFAVDQYREFLNLYFEVVSQTSFLLNETDGHKCVIHGFLCKKKPVTREYYEGNVSWYEQNMASLGRLSKLEPAPKPLERQTIKSYFKKMMSRLL